MKPRHPVDGLLNLDQGRLKADVAWNTTLSDPAVKPSHRDVAGSTGDL